MSTWITQRHQDRRDLWGKRIFHREQLYSDFISQSARAMAAAIQHNFQDPTVLLPSYALLGRMRLSSSIDVFASAERLIQHIIIMYSEPNLTPEEIQLSAGKRQDPLREFSNICRAELEAMRDELGNGSSQELLYECVFKSGPRRSQQFQQIRHSPDKRLRDLRP